MIVTSYFNTDMTTHDKNVWSNNYLFIYGNGFLVKDMTKGAITYISVCLFTTYIRNRNRCI
jgi:hypothetical protein